MRLAALALIVLAFARPFFKRTRSRPPRSSGAREAVILVDTSYSMEYGDRWQRAQAAAPDAIAGSAPAIARRWCSSRRAPKSRSAPPRDRGRLEAGLAAAATGPGATRYRAGAEARGQPARRVRAAAARDHPYQRLPAARLGADARPRRREAAGADDADAGQRRRRRDVEPLGRRRCRCSGRASRTTIASSSPPASSITARRPCRARRWRSKSTASRSSRCPTDVAPGGSSSVTFAPFTVASRNMRGTVRAAGRRPEARQRVPLRRLAVRARAGAASSTAAARSARRSICRARSPSASRRASS